MIWQSDSELDEIRATWNDLADDWRIQVGDEGDANRLLNSDPVLWKFAGDVRGLTVLDAGCGTGYLSKKLHDRGAVVTGIDLSERMIEIARTHNPDLAFGVDSCSTLSTLGDGHFDLLIANYVLMDTPDLEQAMNTFARVLKAGGVAVLVFSHPCFPQDDASATESGVSYHWRSSYFESKKRTDPAWGHFKSEFIWFHRPLSDYWKAFKAAGFDVDDFEEPRLTPERYHLAKTEHGLQSSKHRPYSVAFRLVKRSPAP